MGSPPGIWCSIQGILKTKKSQLLVNKDTTQQTTVKLLKENPGQVEIFGWILIILLKFKMIPPNFANLANVFACCTLYWHLFLENLKHSNHSWEAAMNACMHACMVEQATTKPDHNTPLSLNIWAADCFPHRVLEHSKPQNGVSYLLTTSTSSMRWSILTFSPTEDADILLGAKKYQPELYIVILTFNLILLCLASCPQWPSRWLITARLQLQSPVAQIALAQADSVNTRARQVCLYESLRFMSLPVVLV